MTARTSMGGAPITSPSNPLIRRARALSVRKHRLAERACFVEGIRPVWQAIEHRAAIETLIVAPDLLTSEAAWEMLESAHEGGIPVASVTATLFERLASRDHPSGLAAIVRTPQLSLEKLPIVPDGLYIAIDGAGNPGNLGAIVRTVDAVGGRGVLIAGQATDPFHPVAIKASMGTVFAVPLVQVPDIGATLAWCGQSSIHPIATSGDTGSPHWRIPYPAPCLVLFGSEGAGLPAGVMAACEQVANIPMSGTAGSLNLAVAAGIVLYEARRASWSARPTAGAKEHNST